MIKLKFAANANIHLVFVYLKFHFRIIQREISIVSLRFNIEHHSEDG
jgi:hypothetical protein